MSLAALILASSLIAPPMIQSERNPTHFIFLTTGKNPPKASAEEIAKYQGEHIGNFKRQFEAGKLITAGPMADPAKVKRGIVVLSVKDKSEIPGLFKSDPYVEKGFMDVNAFPIQVLFGKLNTEGIDPQGIVENRIVIFTAITPQLEGPSTRSAKFKHLNHVKLKGPGADLAFYASVTGSYDVRAIALFRGTDDAKVNAWIKSDPLVKSGALKATKMPQWLSRGVL